MSADIITLELGGLLNQLNIMEDGVTELKAKV
jgi:hypothetical protein